MRSRRRRSLAIFIVTFLGAAAIIRWWRQWGVSIEEQHPRPISYFSAATDEQPLPSPTNRQCSMANCFDWSRCLYAPHPKVYVYPDPPSTAAPEGSGTSAHSIVYANILKALRQSALYTHNPEEACLFVLSIDTADRDRISDSYVKGVDAQLRALPSTLWNRGRNHLIFNLYFGTYPNYSDHDLGFDPGEAMIAWASASGQNFRWDYDLSIPLFHKEHHLRTIPVVRRHTHPSTSKKKYLASFKGKRYVYGIGSETRDLLHHFHTNTSSSSQIIIATTCRHNTDWKRFEDARCAADNEEYGRWEYSDLLDNSTFCFIPRGRRLGSFRFLEALRAGCIPVILSDDWVLPFAERIDWTRAVIFDHESTVLFALDYLLAIPEERIQEIRTQTQLLYHRFFGSIERIALTTVEVVFERLRRAEGRQTPSIIQWDSPLGLEVAAPPRFTIVVQGALRPSSRLNRIIKELGGVEGLKKIVVLWPKGRGQPPEEGAFSNGGGVVPLQVVETDIVDQSEFLLMDMNLLEGDLAVLIDERVSPTTKELSHALTTAAANPTRLTTFYANRIEHVEGAWRMEEPSVEYHMGLLHYAVIHKHFLSQYQQGTSKGQWLRAQQWFSPQCHIHLFNFMMADTTLDVPLWLRRWGQGEHPSVAAVLMEPWMDNRNQTLCLNKLISVLYGGELPLLGSLD